MTPLTAGWENFFVAELGAAAALAGLVFVAVSINLTRILAIEHLPERAAETLIILLSVLAVATFGLVPRQDPVLFGIEVGAAGLIVWLASLRIQVRAFRHVEARRWLWPRIIWTQAACVPFIVAGVLIAIGYNSGMYWLVPGTIVSFASGVLNAWVLLVEIQR